jgi:hypothetical protein
MIRAKCCGSSHALKDHGRNRPPAANSTATRRPPIDPSVFMPVLPHPGAHWWEQNGARAAERRSEAERVAAYYDAQERAREERKNAAVRARVRQAQGWAGGTDMRPPIKARGQSARKLPRPPLARVGGATSAWRAQVCSVLCGKSVRILLWRLVRSG